MSDVQPSGGRGQQASNGTSPIYYPANRDGPLRQGDMLSNLVQLHIRLDTVGNEEVVVLRKVHPYAVVLSQDCDLEQDFKNRNAGRQGSLPNVLFCEVETPDTLRGKLDFGSKEWKQAVQNKNERFQFLQALSKEEDALGVGLPSLAMDFKRYFTIPTDEVYARLNGEARRHAILSPIYAQHLCARFSFFLSRVALPLDHAT